MGLFAELGKKIEQFRGSVEGSLVTLTNGLKQRSEVREIMELLLNSTQCNQFRMMAEQVKASLEVLSGLKVTINPVKLQDALGRGQNPISILPSDSDEHELKEQVSFRIQYPPDYQDLSYEDLKEFKKTRYAVADVLIDAASVLGGDVALRILYMKLSEAAACCQNEESERRPAEAALFGIRAISSYVSVVEAEVMPEVLGRIVKLPQHPQLLQTACLTIGAYSKWLDAASVGPSILPSVIDVLMSGLAKSEDSAAAAALTFRQICDVLRKLMGA